MLELLYSIRLMNVELLKFLTKQVVEPFSTDHLEKYFHRNTFVKQIFTFKLTKAQL